MPITYLDEEKSQTPSRTLTFLDGEPRAEPRRTPNFFESETARLLFPTIGQALGTVAGTTLGGATGGIGAFPGGVIGAGTGAGAGAATRQFFARLTGAGPRTATEALTGPIEEAQLGVTGEVLGPVVGRVVSRVGKSVVPMVSRVGQLLTRVPSAAIRRAIERGPGKVLRPEAIREDIAPVTVEKVTTGLQAFKTEIQKAYDTGVANLKPLYQDKKIDLRKLQEEFRQRLIEAKVITPDGKPMATLLKQATTVSRTHTTLSKILNRLSRLPAQRGFRGGFLPVEEAITLKRELDTLLDFDPNAVKEITDEGNRLIFGLRTSLREAIEELVPGLKPLNEEYHTFRDLYNAVQPALKDQRIESTISRLNSKTNRFTFRKLAEINEQLDPEFRFINEALDDLAAQAFSKEPELFSVLPLSLAAGGLLRFGPLGGIGGLLLAGELSSGQSLARLLRGGERFTRGISGLAHPLRPLATSARPVGGTAVSTMMRMLRGEPDRSPE